MADAPTEQNPDADRGVERLLARAAAADARARARLKAVIADMFLPAETRLDDRTRAAIDATLAALVATVERELREHGARLLRARGEAELANGLNDKPIAVTARLWQAGLPRDPDFLRELIGRVRLDLLSDMLPPMAEQAPSRPSLLIRLSDHPDRVIATSARAVLAAENRRRDSRGQDAGGGAADLPAEQHHKLVWWVAAALREPHSGREQVAALDRVLAEAALRSIGAQEEGDRLEAAACRLAAALEPATAEYPDLLVEALTDRRVTLFVAFLAQGMGVPYDAVREIVLDPGGERLWLACRALDLPREAIARIGLRLSEGDPRRDLDRFADEIDLVAAIPIATARNAIAPLRLHPDYRAALDALRRPDA